MAGGDDAAKRLQQAVLEYLRYDEDFEYNHKIVIRVYANLRGLSKTYADKRILPSMSAFSEFVLGFNKAHPLCDFVDAGNHKEAADTKIKGRCSLETSRHTLQMLIISTQRLSVCTFTMSIASRSSLALLPTTLTHPS